MLSSSYCCVGSDTIEKTCITLVECGSVYCPQLIISVHCLKVDNRSDNREFSSDKF